MVNHFPPQALAGVVEDLDLTYDLYDGFVNPTAVTKLPFDTLNGVTYTESQIRKVNIHVGVRSETISKPTQDYVRNHITTSVNVRSLRPSTSTRANGNKDRRLLCAPPTRAASR